MLELNLPPRLAAVVADRAVDLVDQLAELRLDHGLEDLDGLLLVLGTVDLDLLGFEEGSAIFSRFPTHSQYALAWYQSTQFIG